MSNTSQIRELLRERAAFQAKLNLLPYDGSPEVKEVNHKQYLYVRKRIGSRLTSTYVGAYSDELYNLLLQNARDAREYRKQIRHLDKALAELGHVSSELSPEVIRNLEFARVNMKTSIYEQAVLEGVSTTFPQTEDIIEGGEVNGMTVQDVQKVLNLKHAWEFVLDPDVLTFPSSLDILQHIGKLVNEGFFTDGGAIRSVPVRIGGTSYTPPVPFESRIREELDALIDSDDSTINVAIKLCLYCMKTQVFQDGNKRAAVIFANHYLISRGAGLLVIPEGDVPQFRELLVAYYEGHHEDEMMDFMQKKAYRSMD